MEHCSDDEALAPDSPNLNVNVVSNPLPPQTLPLAEMSDSPSAKSSWSVKFP
jgi:hypothetical protein